METIILVIALLFALSFHEAAHAYAAYRLGDDTAKVHGRLTLNPLAHLDPIGTMMLILFKIGWGKPVPVNPNNFKRPAVDNFLVALAGPGVNLVLSIISAFALRLLSSNPTAAAILSLFIVLNIFLMVFNLLPIPPLDGSKVWHLFLNDESYYTLERMGPIILIAFLFFSYSYGGIFTIVEKIASWIISIIT